MDEKFKNEAKAAELSLDELKEVSGGEVIACNVRNPYSHNYPYYTLYRAVSGNSFWSIATAFRVDFNVLMNENPQYRNKKYKLNIGDMVYIPQREYWNV